MTIRDIIDLLESQGEWVNRSCTRDRILFGEDQTEISKVITCWVATNKVIQYAIEHDIHFIISHENPFYLASTTLPTLIYRAQKEKEALLKENNITIYRCHDLWDVYPKYGIRDSWANTLDLNFEELHDHSYYRYTNDINMTVEECAQHIINRIKLYHQQGIEIIGDKTQIIHRLGIGTGACTDVFEMYEEGADACLVSDDGVSNWIGVQWAVDHDIPLIVINHMTCEAPGMEPMVEYLSKQFPEVTFTFVANDYGIYHMDE